MGKHVGVGRLKRERDGMGEKKRKGREEGGVF